MPGLGLLITLLTVFAIVGFFLWLYARVARKAGYSGWWSLTMLVPVVNVVMLWVFAFADWPSQKRHKNIPDIFE